MVENYDGENSWTGTIGKDYYDKVRWGDGKSRLVLLCCVVSNCMWRMQGGRQANIVKTLKWQIYLKFSTLIWNLLKMAVCTSTWMFIQYSKVICFRKFPVIIVVCLPKILCNIERCSVRDRRVHYSADYLSYGELSVFIRISGEQQTVGTIYYLMILCTSVRLWLNCIAIYMFSYFKDSLSHRHLSGILKFSATWHESLSVLNVFEHVTVFISRRFDLEMTNVCCTALDYIV